MSTTPIHSPEYEYVTFSQVFAAKDPNVMPVTVDARVLKEYSLEGASLFRTKTAGIVKADGWKLDFGIIDDEGLLTVTLGDVFRLPKKERERLAQFVVPAPLNARFLKMRLGMGACTDEGEILAWDGELAKDPKREFKAQGE